MPQTTKKTKDRAGKLIQLVGLILLGAGCAFELIHRANIWLIVITVGSIIFAIGTKLKGD